MSELIPEINWTDFARIVKQGNLENMKACEVMFNGIYQFTAIIGHGDFYTAGYARTQAEFLGMKANIAGGLDPQELLKEKVAV